MASWQDEYRTMLSDCEEREDQITEWERNFVQSLNEQIDRERVPSAKQIDKLNDIWERVTSGKPKTRR